METETPGGDHRERLLGGYAGRMFLSITFGAAVLQVGRFLVPLLLPTISTELELTSVTAGLALTVMTLASALFQYPSGRLSDRLTRKTVLVSSFVLGITGYALLGGAFTYGVLLPAMFVIGAGTGLYAAAARALLSDLYTARRGQAFGLHMAVNDSGGIVASGVATAVLAVASWQFAFAPVVALLGVNLLLLHRWSREAITFSAVDLRIGETGRRLFGNARIRRLTIVYALFMFSVQGILGFLPTFLQAERSFAPSWAAATFATLFLVGIVCRPLAGLVSDRVPRQRIAFGALTLAAAGVLVFSLAPGAVPIVAGVVLFAVGQKSFPPVMQAHLMDVFPDESMGGDLGAMRTVYIGISSLGPTYVGLVGSWLDYAAAFTGLVGLIAASAVLLLALTLSDD